MQGHNATLEHERAMMIQQRLRALEDENRRLRAMNEELTHGIPPELLESNLEAAYEKLKQAKKDNKALREQVDLLKLEKLERESSSTLTSQQTREAFEHNLEPHMFVDVVDAQSKWAVGIVKAVRDEQVLVGYHGWSDSFDRTFHVSSPLIQPFGTKTVPVTLKPVPTQPNGATLQELADSVDRLETECRDLRAERDRMYRVMSLGCAAVVDDVLRLFAECFNAEFEIEKSVHGIGNPDDTAAELVQLHAKIAAFAQQQERAGNLYALHYAKLAEHLVADLADILLTYVRRARADASPQVSPNSPRMQELIARVALIRRQQAAAPALGQFQRSLSDPTSSTSHAPSAPPLVPGDLDAAARAQGPPAARASAPSPTPGLVSASEVNEAFLHVQVAGDGNCLFSAVGQGKVINDYLRKNKDADALEAVLGELKRGENVQKISHDCRRWTIGHINQFVEVYAAELTRELQTALRDNAPDDTSKRLRAALLAEFAEDMEEGGLNAVLKRCREERALQLYLQVMATPGVYGQRIELQALSAMFQVPICVLFEQVHDGKSASGEPRLAREIITSPQFERDGDGDGDDDDDASKPIYVFFSLSRSHFDLLVPRPEPNPLAAALLKPMSAGRSPSSHPVNPDSQRSPEPVASLTPSMQHLKLERSPAGSTGSASPDPSSSRGRLPQRRPRLLHQRSRSPTRASTRPTLSKLRSRARHHPSRYRHRRRESSIANDSGDEDSPRNYAASSGVSLSSLLNSPPRGKPRPRSRRPAMRRYGDDDDDGYAYRGPNEEDDDDDDDDAGELIRRVRSDESTGDGGSATRDGSRGSAMDVEEPFDADRQQQQSKLQRPQLHHASVQQRLRSDAYRSGFLDHTQHTQSSVRMSPALGPQRGGGGRVMSSVEEREEAIARDILARPLHRLLGSQQMSLTSSARETSGRMRVDGTYEIAVYYNNERTLFQINPNELLNSFMNKFAVQNHVRQDELIFCRLDRRVIHSYDTLNTADIQDRDSIFVHKRRA